MRRRESPYACAQDAGPWGNLAERVVVLAEVLGLILVEMTVTKTLITRGSRVSRPAQTSRCRPRELLVLKRTPLNSIYPSSPTRPVSRAELLRKKRVALPPLLRRRRPPCQLRSGLQTKMTSCTKHSVYPDPFRSSCRTSLRCCSSSPASCNDGNV